MKKNNNAWIVKAFLLTFFIAIIVSGVSSTISNYCNFYVLIIITILIIGIGIMFDIIGTSVLTAHEANFHAMAANKVKGSKQGIKLIKNNSSIASFCNDVVGDICGIVSGSMGAMISLYLANAFNFNGTITTLLISSLISSITVGGKALGKKYATKNCDKIISLVGKLLNNFEKDK